MAAALDQVREAQTGSLAVLGKVRRYPPCDCGSDRLRFGFSAEDSWASLVLAPWAKRRATEEKGRIPSSVTGGEGEGQLTDSQVSAS